MSVVLMLLIRVTLNDIVKMSASSLTANACV